MEKKEIKTLEKIYCNLLLDDKAEEIRRELKGCGIKYRDLYDIILPDLKKAKMVVSKSTVKNVLGDSSTQNPYNVITRFKILDMIKNNKKINKAISIIEDVRKKKKEEKEEKKKKLLRMLCDENLTLKNDGNCIMGRLIKESLNFKNRDVISEQERRNYSLYMERIYKKRKKSEKNKKKIK